MQSVSPHKSQGTHNRSRLLLPTACQSPLVDKLKQCKTEFEERNEMLARSCNELEEKLQLEKAANKSLDIQLHLSHDRISQQSHQLQELEARNQKAEERLSSTTVNLEQIESAFQALQQEHTSLLRIATQQYLIMEHGTPNLMELLLDLYHYRSRSELLERFLRGPSVMASQEAVDWLDNQYRRMRDKLNWASQTGEIAGDFDGGAENGTLCIG